MSQIKFIKERCMSCDWGTCTDYMQQHLLQVYNFYNNATQQHLIGEENFLLYQKTNLRSLNPTRNHWECHTLLKSLFPKYFFIV